MISYTKTEVIIEDEEDIDRQVDFDWWVARCQYFKEKYYELEKENKELRKKLKKRLTDIF